MDRREFLTRMGLVGGAAVFGPTLLGACDDNGSNGTASGGSAPAFTSILDSSASNAPIDTVVVMMMENRSFDHYLGWLAAHEGFLEHGRSRYGGDFQVDGNQTQTFRTPTDSEQETVHWLAVDDQSNPWRGCGFEDPGHGWEAGRVQRDRGFLAEGSGNDKFALGYYLGDDVPFHNRLAQRFTTFDQWHASILGPTFPNREYLHSGQSGGQKTNYLPFEEGGFQWTTIWDRLQASGVPARYYYHDLPVVSLWGERLLPLASTIDGFFDDASAGKLPNVVFVDPRFVGPEQNDDHPHADIRAGQRLLRDVFSAFVQSPHWERGAFILTYDEWGGFFDHVAPPEFPDDRVSDVDQENFAQAGFRVPSLIASPYARPGYVDHTTMEHTSALRFLEWRFLGAPATGPGRDGDGWFLTARDRNAYNLGAALGLEDPDPEVDLDLDIAEPSPGCAEDDEGAEGEAEPVAVPTGSAWTEMVDAGYLERTGFDRRSAPVLA